MEINYKKKECIIFPQLTCVFCICIYIGVISIYNKKYNFYLILLCPVVALTLCFYFINRGIIEKNFNKFRTGLMISLIFSISSAAFKILNVFCGFLTIFLLFGRTYKNNDLFFLMFSTSLIDFIFSAILFCFKNKVKKFCENQKYNENEFTNAPLIV